MPYFRAMRYVQWLRWRMRYAIAFLVPLFCRRKERYPPRRILCLVSGGVGDRLMALPALRHLRNLYGQARLCVVWLDGALEVVNGEFIDCIGNGRRKWPIIMAISVAGWDMVFVNIQGIFSVLSEWCVLLSRAPTRIGPVSAAGPTIYSHPYLHRTDCHITAINLRAVDSSVAAVPAPYPVDITKSRQSLLNGFLRVGLHPCVRKGYEIKRWPPQRWRELIAALGSHYHCETMVIAGPGEQKYCNTLTGGLSASSVYVATVEALFNAVALCGLIIGADSGVVHCAAALGVPVVAIFGPTDPCRVAPVGSRVMIVQAACDARPCFDVRRSCIRQPSCMERVSVRQVLDAVETLLQKTGEKSSSF